MQNAKSVFTCECVSSLVSEIPHCLQQLIFRGEVVELPFCARVSTVLGQTWGKNQSLHMIFSVFILFCYFRAEVQKYTLSVLKGVILGFFVSNNLQMILQSQIAVLNDAKVWDNEVRVCSNPCGLFLKTLNAPFSSVFCFFLNLRPLVCHTVLGFSVGSSGRCVWTGQSEQTKPFEAGLQLKQSVSDRDKNPGKNRAAAVSCMRKQMSFLNINLL